MPLLFLLLLFLTATAISAGDLPAFREAPAFRNGKECPRIVRSSLDNPSMIHIAMTLDETYLRGSVAGVFSVLQHASCPENIVFHFIASRLYSHNNNLRHVITSTFPYLSFHLYLFDSNLVKGKISYSIRRALDQPLNYARIYLADLVPSAVRRIIYFDSDLIVVDDVAKLWNINLGKHVVGAPEYCHANFSHYFTQEFWSRPVLAASLKGRKACYFNTGVMVIDIWKWREGKFTQRLEYWMRIQKRYRIYELGSLPPFLLVFAGDVEGVEHRWNQHGLGGDNLEGLCRNLHPGPVSLLHWSGKESKYQALASTAAELCWLRQLLKDLGIFLSTPPKLWCAHVSALAIASNPVFHAKTKHIEVDYHFIRERVLRRDLLVKYIATDDQLANDFTKNLLLLASSSSNPKSCSLSAPMTLRGDESRRDKVHFKS